MRKLMNLMIITEYEKGRVAETFIKKLGYGADSFEHLRISLCGQVRQISIRKHRRPERQRRSPTHYTTMDGFMGVDV